MATEVIDEVRIIRNMILDQRAKFVVVTASERTTGMYVRNTGKLQSPSVTVDSSSLQAFNVGENKVKLLFKVE